MAHEIHLPPRASSLINSMRDLGYSLETAIADLVDNSITAEANRIEIFCDISTDDPALAIIDNGCGMDRNELLAAMRHGETDPGDERTSGDLGRFGLGLKTASLSQCRRLTVVSLKNGNVNGAEWNLDLVKERDEWLITVLDSDEIRSLPFISNLPEKGTVVLWRNLDRLTEGHSGHKLGELVNEKLDMTRRHLSLVFQQFIEGRYRSRMKLSIFVNGHQLEPFDPFCRKNTATQVMPEEYVLVDDSQVRIQPYILPHHSKLTASEYDYYQDRSDFISNQGAYIYRNGRLMAWGDWFRLIPKGESTKLARVQIDFTSSQDRLWTIDIKKSRAQPPVAVRERLRQILARITVKSTRVHSGRGQKLFEEIKAPVWERFADHDKIRYSVNSSHPLIKALFRILDEDTIGLVHLILESISTSLPVEMIYSDYSTQPRDFHLPDLEKETVLEKLKLLKQHLFTGSPKEAEIFREIVRSVRLFRVYEETTEEFIRREFK